MNKKNTKDWITKKLQPLIIDKRSYKDRFFIAASIALVFCFTFLFFGPVEITAFGQKSMNFTVEQITPLMGTTMLSVFIPMSFIIALVPGKIFDFIASAIFSVVLCGYIQGNYLNSSIGALTGDAIFWQNMKLEMLLNLLIWIVIGSTSYILLFFSKKVWKNYLIYGSLLLFSMQFVALIAIGTTVLSSEHTDSNCYLSTEGMTEYSSEHNTFVFLLDRMDYDCIEEILADNPDYFHQFDGFTSYTNAISEYARTKPAANYIFNACEDKHYQIPQNEYFDYAWTANNKHILKDLSNSGCKISIYGDFNSLFGSGELAKKYVDNCSDTKEDLNKPVLIKNLIYLSAYRYSAITLKPFFWCYTDTITSTAYKDSNLYKIDESIFASLIPEFQANDTAKYFKFYHFNGAHEPYVLTENGEISTTETNRTIQSKGSFHILLNAFKKMKELNIYEDATIIITADHGNSISDIEPLQKATKIALFYKASGEAGTPLKESKAPVSLKNIGPTILKSVGADYLNYGRPLDEIGENEQIQRTFYKYVMTDGHEAELYVYDVIDDASVFENWHLREVQTIIYPYY